MSGSTVRSCTFRGLCISPRGSTKKTQSRQKAKAQVKRFCLGKTSLQIRGIPGARRSSVPNARPQQIILSAKTVVSRRFFVRAPLSLLKYYYSSNILSVNRFVDFPYEKPRKLSLRCLCSNNTINKFLPCFLLTPHPLSAYWLTFPSPMVEGEFIFL